VTDVPPGDYIPSMWLVLPDGTLATATADGLAEQIAAHRRKAAGRRHIDLACSAMAPQGYRAERGGALGKQVSLII
jgi:hypothetical protein